jgi:hypothetical protein
MRKLLFMLLLVPLLSVGQSVVNSTFAFTYLGYSGGSYKVTIQNKQACYAVVRVNWPGNNSFVTIPPLTTSSFSLPGTYQQGEKLRIKPEADCSANNSNWMEIVVAAPTVLAIKLTDFKLLQQGESVRLTFAATFDPGDYIVIERSSDSRLWQQVSVINSPAIKGYTDPNPLQGRSYYRLRLVEPDKVAYSKVLQVYTRLDEGPQLALYTIDGKFIRQIDRHSLSSQPRGLYLTRRGEQWDKIYIP